MNKKEDIEKIEKDRDHNNKILAEELLETERKKNYTELTNTVLAGGLTKIVYDMFKEDSSASGITHLLNKLSLGNGMENGIAGIVIIFIIFQQLLPIAEKSLSRLQMFIYKKIEEKMLIDEIRREIEKEEFTKDEILEIVNNIEIEEEFKQRITKRIKSL